MQLKKIIKLIICMQLCAFMHSAYAVELHITTGFTTPVSDFFSRVLKEVDIRNEDIKISFEQLPAERSLDLVNKGINDGECCRIPEVVKAAYPNMVAIGVTFYSAKFSAFVNSKEINVSTFEDLKPYSVAVPKGWKIVVDRVGEIEPRQLYTVTSIEQLIGMVEKNRVDVGVVGLLSGLDEIKKSAYTGVFDIKPPLVEKKLYLMLHKKHSALIERIEGTLQKMNDDGTISQIMSDFVPN